MASCSNERSSSSNPSSVIEVTGSLPQEPKHPTGDLDRRLPFGDVHDRKGLGICDHPPLHDHLPRSVRYTVDEPVGLEFGSLPMKVKRMTNSLPCWLRQVARQSRRMDLDHLWLRGAAPVRRGR